MSLVRVLVRNSTSDSSEQPEEEEQHTPYNELPSGIITGMVCSIVACKIKHGHTKPPGPLTESELITQMEKNGKEKPINSK